jgi:ribosomal RNA-processing protein 9
LFFSGFDRKIHAYDCQTMKYMNSFFGPTAPTMAMDCLYQNKVFIGGGDCVPMILKPEAETIVSFGFKDSRDLLSIDALAAIDHDNFVTGTQTNILQLWSSSKKTPHNSIPNAHTGRTMAHLGTQRYGLTMQTTSRPIENWIISLAALYASDLVVSGSSDGYIRAWRAHLTEKELRPVFNIPVQGFVNGLQIGQNGRFLLAAVGKNHRLGTWQGHITDGVKEGLYFYDLAPLYDGDNGAGNGFVHQFADNDDLGNDDSGGDDNE